MQRYTIEHHKDLPVIFTTYDVEFGGRDDVLAYSDDIAKVYANLKTPVYHIGDFRYVNLSMQDIMLSIKRGVHSSDSIVRSPMHLRMIIVTENKFYITIVNTMLKAPFSLMNAHVCRTVDEALDWVRAQIEISKP